jgi:hypothetical protein
MRCILATVVIAAVVMAADNPGYLPMMPPGIHVGACVCVGVGGCIIVIVSCAGAVYESPTDPAVKKIVDQGTSLLFQRVCPQRARSVPSTDLTFAAAHQGGSRPLVRVQTFTN